MLLVDTCVWVNHFRKRDPILFAELQENNVSIHPFIITELVLGSLPKRREAIAALDELPKVEVAHTDEVRRMIETHLFFQQGIGFVDAHLIASTMITPGTFLWTQDQRLRKLAVTLSISAPF